MGLFDKRYDHRTEEPTFLNALIQVYGKGNEFRAGDAFKLISDDFISWYAEAARANNVYSISWRESAALELLEGLLSKGALRNKRVETRNEYGDEDWYYTVA